MRVQEFFSSKHLALALFFGLAILLIPDTFTKDPSPFLQIVKLSLLGLISINLFFCTINRLSQLKKSTLLIHLGCLTTIIGSLGSHLGFVATVNIHEGGSTTTAYRWDKQAETALGFEIGITKINRQYYPTMVKVGVIDNGKKAGLFQLKTGEGFSYGEFDILVKSLDIANQSLQLAISKDKQHISNFDTTKGSTGRDFPLDFKLVAFQDPVLKKIWVDLELQTRDEHVTGASQVNAPLIWDGIRFFHTASAVDPYGVPYAGIQIVRDPGVPIVYLGCLIILCGCFLILIRKTR